MAERFFPSKFRRKLINVGASVALGALHIAGTSFILDHDFSFTDPLEIDSDIEVVPDLITYERRILGLPEYEYNTVLHLITISDVSKIDFVMDPDSDESTMEVTAKTVLRFMRENDVDVVFNGSYFVPFRKGRYPGNGDSIHLLGNTIWQGETLSEPQVGYGVFCVDSEGNSSIVDFACPEEAQVGIAGKEILVNNGQILNDLNSIDHHPRTAIGIVGSQMVIMAVEGRNPYSMGMTLEELAKYGRDMEVDYLLNLDGGGSSAIAIFIDGKATVVNRDANSPFGDLRFVFPVGISVK